jgi:hypothetical protein
MSFERHARAIMGEVAEAAAAVLRDTKTPIRIADIVARLGLDKTLAWHVKVLAEGETPLSNVEHVPGPEATRILLNAARSRKAKPATLKRFERAIEAFNRMLLAEASGDRRTLATMLAALGASPADSRSLANVRRAAFRANSAIFGFRCRIQFQIDLARLDDTGMLDLGVIRGWTGFTRLRSDAAWLVARSRQHVDGTRVEKGLAEPFDPAAAEELNVPLVPDFSTSPLPAFRDSPDSRGEVNRYIADGPIGRDGEVDLVFGEVLRGIAPPTAPVPDQFGEVFARLHTPAELFVHDWLLEKRLVEGPWRGRVPRWILFNELGASLQHPNGEKDKPRLPVPGGVEMIGPADVATPPHRTIRYHQVVSYACRKLSRRPKDFVVFRAMLKYPPIPCTSALRIDLPVVRVP